MGKFDKKEYIYNFCDKIKRRINSKVLISVSGGVDSATSAALLKRSGVDYEVLLMDTGYMRENEIQEVVSTFEKMGYNLKILDKKEEFYLALEGISDPREKRNVFREKYFEVFTQYLIENNLRFIAQGTQFWNSQVKVYHNCPTKLFDDQKLKVIEPVKGVSKNNIRKLAKELGLPDKVVNRRPFPGPGLLIRFGGDFSLEKLKLIREATFIVDKFVEKYKNDFKECYQVFPYLCDCSPVTYINKKGEGDLGCILLVRAVSQKMQNGVIKYVPFQMESKLKEKFVDDLMRLDNVGRVCFDSTSKLGFGSNVKPGATIEYI